MLFIWVQCLSPTHQCLVAQSCLTLSDPVDCSPPGSSVHGFFSGKNTGVDCHFLLQGIFPTQGSNPRLLCLVHCRQVLYSLGHPGSPESVVMRLSQIARMVSSVSAIGVLEHVHHKRATTAEDASSPWAIGQAPDRRALSGIVQGETTGWESPGNCLVMTSKTLRGERGT